MFSSPLDATRISGNYFSTRAFFKKKLPDSRVTTIPSIERRVLGIEEGDSVNVVGVPILDEIDTLFAQDVTVTTDGAINIPKSAVRDTFTLRDNELFRETIDIDDEDVRQFVVSKDDSLETVLDRRIEGNRRFLFNNLIFKAKLGKLSPDADTLKFSVPNYELRNTDTQQGDDLNTVIVDASQISLARRDVFRTTIRSGGGASIPAERVRIRNMEPDSLVQVVAQKPKLS